MAASMRLDAQDDKYLAERQRQRERRQPLRRAATRAFLKRVASSPPTTEPAQLSLFGQEVTGK